MNSVIDWEYGNRFFHDPTIKREKKEEEKRAGKYVKTIGITCLNVKNGCDEITQKSSKSNKMVKEENMGASRERGGK